MRKRISSLGLFNYLKQFSISSGVRHTAGGIMKNTDLWIQPYPDPILQKNLIQILASRKFVSDPPEKPYTDPSLQKLRIRPSKKNLVWILASRNSISDPPENPYKDPILQKNLIRILASRNSVSNPLEKPSPE